MRYTRNFTATNYRNWYDKRNTGFRLEWEYFPSIHDVETVNFAPCNAECEIYVKLANMLHLQMFTEDKITAELTYFLTAFVLRPSENGPDPKDIMEKLENNLNLESSKREKLLSNRYTNMSKSTLVKASKLLPYFKPKTKAKSKWITFLWDQYYNILRQYSLRKIISLVAELPDTENTYKNVILENLEANHNLLGLKKILKGDDLGKTFF